MTCKQILFDFLKKNEGWHKKVHLYAEAEDYSPETVGRALRELEEEGKIRVGYYDGKYAKGLAKYTTTPLKKIYYKLPDGTIITKYEKN